jgi:hypothetical protein
MIRAALRFLFHWLRLGVGWAAYLLTGRSPAFAYQSLVLLFCRSGGASNDALSRRISRARPAYRFPDAAGVLGDLSGQNLAEFTGRLDRDGYCVFPVLLPEAICQRLTEFALRQPSVIRRDESGSAAGGARVAYAEDRAAPRGVSYDFGQNEILANRDVQALLCDRSLLSVAQSYLRAQPMADVLAFWWNTAFNAAPSEASAQYFHFDMDRVKWLKFFFHLSDVGPESGPHSFVRGSHRTGGIPERLLAKGYARLRDDDVRDCYPASDFVEFQAPRGTILAEDTRGLHKGKVVTRGDRLILQLQFSSSLFGATYPKSRLPAEVEPGLRQALAAYPRIYAAFR